MSRIYAVGDIHGFPDQLDRALDLIEADGGPDAPVVFVGDYVDRGPDSRGVIDILSEGLDQGRNWTCLTGNHDRLFERFIEWPEPRHDPHLLVGYHWFHDRIGGTETALSYGVPVPDRIRQQDLAAELRDAVPDRHKRFLQELQIQHITDTAVFVHAGVRPGVPLSQQTENDMVWIRQEFLQDTSDHGRLVVHGHTPVDARPELHLNRLAIDTGAGYGRSLHPVVLEGTEVFTLTPHGRERLSVIRN